MKRTSLKVTVSLLFLTAVALTRVLAQAPPPTGEWTKDDHNPVLRPGPEGTWDSGAVFGPSVILTDDTLRMWYTANLATTTAVVAPAIGHATTNARGDSAWTRATNNPVLSSGPPGSWDAEGVESPTVLQQGSTYHLWYTGQNEDGLKQVGYATSPDGLSWSKNEANPVLEAGSGGTWDSQGVSPGSVLRIDRTYHMWYTGTNVTGTVLIGLATSPDGINWTRRTQPVFYPITPNAWDGFGVSRPAVIFDGEMYRMWYAGVSSQGQSGIGYATSPDGINWTRAADIPALTTGGAGDWDAADVDEPAVIYDPSMRQYSMWYVGRPEEGRRRIGHATVSTAYLTYLPLIRR